jgi:hypothetical protein
MSAFILSFIMTRYRLKKIHVVHNKNGIRGAHLTKEAATEHVTWLKSKENPKQRKSHYQISETVFIRNFEKENWTPALEYGE